MDEIPMDYLLPKNGREADEYWKKILGEQYGMADAQDRSQIIRELRRNGQVNGLVNGKVIKLKNPRTKFRTLSDGKTERYYEGNVLVKYTRFPSKDQSENTFINL